jgi:hypothetical protein
LSKTLLNFLIIFFRFCTIYRLKTEKRRIIKKFKLVTCRNIMEDESLLNESPIDLSTDSTNMITLTQIKVKSNTKVFCLVNIIWYMKMSPVQRQHHGFCRIQPQKISTTLLKTFTQITVYLPNIFWEQRAKPRRIVG